MKRVFFDFSRVLLIVGLISICFGCDKDDDGGVAVPDPEGTIIHSLGNYGIKNTYVPVEQGSNLTFHTHNNYEWIAMNIYNNFVVQRATITSVGKVKGLGCITKVPTSGYAGQASVEISHGYVMQLECGDYVRIYVVDWVLNTSNGIIGAKIKYQFPWIPDNIVAE